MKFMSTLKPRKDVFQTKPPTIVRPLNYVPIPKLDWNNCSSYRVKSGKLVKRYTPRSEENTYDISSISVEIPSSVLHVNS